MRTASCTLLMLLLVSEFSFSQNWSCVPEGKSYYTNSRGYLRGMRLDSTSNENGVKISFPFKTARTEYWAWAAEADTTGGSWWGKALIETLEGETYIETVSGDSILINNNANINDQWIFFGNSDIDHYRAELISIDTMTILGTLDSVKTIRISSWEGLLPKTQDSLNGLEIKLSKEHGFVYALDFYLFPYQISTDNYNPHFDCYFFESVGAFNINATSLIFKRVDLKLPYSLNIYNFSVGDQLYESSTYSFSSGGYTNTFTKNTYLDKANTDSGLLYSINFETTERRQSSNGPIFTDTAGITTQYISDYLLMDTTYMPEEWYSGKTEGTYTYYLPEDSSFCFKSPRYMFSKDKIINNLFGGGGPEPSFPRAVYKEGLGQISFDRDGHIPNGGSSSGGLWYANKNGVNCDAINELVSVRDLNSGENFLLKLYPNPVENLLHIAVATTASDLIRVSIYDILGKQTTDLQFRTPTFTIDVSKLPNGIYFLKVNKNGNAVIKKIVIAH